MNETLETTKKTEAQTSAQIGRIANRLALRASKLPEEVNDTWNPTAEFSSYHSGGANGPYDVAHNKDSSYKSMNPSVYGQEGGTKIEAGDDEVSTTIIAKKGRLYGQKDSHSDSIELTHDQTVHEAAKTLSDLRGEVAAREILSKK